MGVRGWRAELEHSGIDGIRFRKFLKDLILVFIWPGWWLIGGEDMVWGSRWGDNSGGQEGGGRCVRRWRQGAVGRWDYWCLPLKQLHNGPDVGWHTRLQPGKHTSKHTEGDEFIRILFVNQCVLQLKYLTADVIYPNLCATAVITMDITVFSLKSDMHVKSPLLMIKSIVKPEDPPGYLSLQSI